MQKEEEEKVQAVEVHKGDQELESTGSWTRGEALKEEYKEKQSMKKNMVLLGALVFVGLF